MQLISYYAIIILTSSYCFGEVFTGPVTSATGGAGRAATEVGETILLNPATIVHAPEFSSALFFTDGYWSQDLHERVYGGSIIDNHKGSVFPGGITYLDRKRHFSSVGSVKEMFVQATVGSFVMKHLSVGLALTYLRQKHNNDSHQQWNGQLGLMYNPNSSMGLALVAQNLIEPSSSIPSYLKEPLNVGGGLTYLFDKFLKLKADVVAYDDEFKGWRGKYMLGLESIIGQFGAFRLGWNKNDLSGYKYYTIGLGFNGPKFRIDYSYQQKDTYRRGGMHSVDFRVPL